MNRYLRRQVEKFLSLETSSLDEVSAWFRAQGAAEQPESVRSFVDGFDGFFKALDRSFTDFERVVKSRETSLEIAEAESTKLNQELSDEAAVRLRVLARLQEIVAALDAKGEVLPGSSASELERLTSSVEELARSHQSRLRDIRLIFAESLRLSKSKTWLELADNLAVSARSLLGKPVSVLPFAATSMLKPGASEDRYQGLQSTESAQSFSKETLAEGCTWLYPISLTAADGPGLVLQLFAPSFSEAERERFTNLFEALTPAVFSTCELIRFVGEVQRRSQLEAELNTARLVQQTLMPNSSVDIPNVIEVRAFFRTATECGGDWWSCYSLPDNRQVVLVGDVSGHGTASALVTALAKGFCDAAVIEPNFSARLLFERLDALLARISSGTQRAMSLVAAVFDPARGEVEISSAGHPPVQWLSMTETGARHVRAVSGSSDLLGISRPAGVKAQVFTLVQRYAPGDAWVLYSDGLVEVNSPQGVAFGNGRLLRILRGQTEAASAAQMLDALTHAFDDFVKPAEPDDDVTVVIVKAAAA